MNKYPIVIIPKATLPKNIASSFIVITLFKMIASGKDSQAIDIINANDVPSGIPLAMIPNIKDTTEYSDMIKHWAVYTRMHANSVLNLLDLKIVDGNGDEIPGFTIAPDSFTPPVMIYTD